MRNFLTIFGFFIAISTFSQNNKKDVNELPIPKNPELFYNPITFDSDTCCWRKLGNDKKYLDAATLIVLYLETNKPKNKHSLNWHAGQMFAMANSYKLAKKYFKRTYCILYKLSGDTDVKTWYYYAKGTVAFIDNDKKSLEEIIHEWSKKFPADNNFNVLVRLNDNWGKSYELALYSLFLNKN